MKKSTDALRRNRDGTYTDTCDQGHTYNIKGEWHECLICLRAKVANPRN